MRPFILVLLLLGLVVRWADAACGCAAHNGWLTIALDHSHSHDGHHDHDSSGPCLHEGCEGEGGRAIYVASGRILPPATADLPSSVLPVELALSASALEDRAASSRLDLAPSRAALNVYRL